MVAETGEKRNEGGWDRDQQIAGLVSKSEMGIFHQLRHCYARNTGNFLPFTICLF